MSSDPAPRLATYDDVIALPDNVVGEIIEGELIVSPRPAAPHALTASVIGGDLMAPFGKGRGGPGGWWIISEPELHPGSHVLVPDVAGWRRERMPAFTAEPFFTLPPDWVCEIVSPRSWRNDRARKLPIYLEHGVSWAWLVDPIARTLEIFESAETHWKVVGAHRGNEIVRAAPFEAIELELESWWLPSAEETQPAGGVSRPGGPSTVEVPDGG